MYKIGIYVYVILFFLLFLVQVITAIYYFVVYHRVREILKPNEPIFDPMDDEITQIKTKEQINLDRIKEKHEGLWVKMNLTFCCLIVTTAVRLAFYAYQRLKSRNAIVLWDPVQPSILYSALATEFIIAVLMNFAIWTSTSVTKSNDLPQIESADEASSVDGDALIKTSENTSSANTLIKTPCKKNEQMPREFFNTI